MTHNETFIGIATTARGLIYTLNTYVPEDATIELVGMANVERQCNVEVWYNKDTNTVILK